MICRWLECGTGQYNHPVTGDTGVLNAINENEELYLVIFRHTIETTVKSLTIGELPGIDNIPVESGQMTTRALMSSQPVTTPY